MKKTALITGASSGIGLEFAKIFANDGYNLVLAARRGEKLESLKKELESKHDILVTNIVQDLTAPNACQDVFNQTSNANLQIDVLVNNAGFGKGGRFINSNISEQLSMINLNVSALVELTHLYLPQMVKRNSGNILNVASVAAFFPGPLMAVYYATKAFVVSFSEALDAELNGTNIKVTTLCPGITKSEFQQVAYGKSGEEMYGKNIPTSKQVAQFGYDSMVAGKGVVVYGAINKFYVLVSKILPARFFAKAIMKKHGGK